jgi:tRNA 2-thiouridine synthesizing protein A
MHGCGTLEEGAKRLRRAYCSRDAQARQACQIQPAWLQWETAAQSTHHKEDARGLNCPLPILRAKKALTDMQTGQVLRIVSTDLGSVKDFQAFCKQTGNELLSQTEASNEYTFFLKRK